MKKITVAIIALCIIVIGIYTYKVYSNRTKPIPYECGISETFVWDELDIKDMSLKELVDSFGQPGKYAYPCKNLSDYRPNEILISDELCKMLEKKYPDRYLLQYDWNTLPNSKMRLTIYVLALEDKLIPIDGYAESDYWNDYKM